MNLPGARPRTAHSQSRGWAVVFAESNIVEFVQLFLGGVLR